MQATEPKPSVSTECSFLDDVLAAIVCFAFGGPVGYLVLLGVCSLLGGDIPKATDFRGMQWTFVWGFFIGAPFAVILRLLIHRVRRRSSWALGFFALGAIVTPLLGIGLLAFAMSGSGGW